MPSRRGDSSLRVREVRAGELPGNAKPGPRETFARERRFPRQRRARGSGSSRRTRLASGYAPLAVKTIAADVLIHEEPDSVRQAAVRGMVPFFEGRGYQLDSQSADGLKLTHRYMSIWAGLGGLLIFPIGIFVWIFVRREEIVTFSFSREGSGTRVLIRGKGEAYVKQYVDLFQAEHDAPDEPAAVGP